MLVSYYDCYRGQPSLAFSLAHEKSCLPTQTPTRYLACWGFFGTKYVPQNDKGNAEMASGDSHQDIRSDKRFPFATPYTPVILRLLFGRRIPTLRKRTMLVSYYDCYRGQPSLAFSPAEEKKLPAHSNTHALPGTLGILRNKVRSSE